MPNIGFSELLIIAALAVLLFGSRLPGVGKALGTGIRNFKKGLAGGDDEDEAKSSAKAAPLRPSAAEAPDSSSGQGATPIKARVALSDAPHSLTGPESSQAQPASGAKRDQRKAVVDADDDTPY